MRSGNGWVTCEQGHQHWGLFGAAGLLAYAPDPEDQTQILVLLQHRARWSHQGGTWALPGGAMDSEETPAEAALREADEECMLDPKLVLPRGMYTEEHGGWAYHTIMAQAAEPFRVYSDAYESDENVWLPVGHVDRRDLHPGFAACWPLLRAALLPLTVFVDGTGKSATAAAALLARLAGLTRTGIASLPDGLAATALARWYPDYVLLLDDPLASGADEPEPAVQKAGYSWNEPLAVRTAEVRVVAAGDHGRPAAALPELARSTPGRRLVVSDDPLVRERAAATGAAVTDLNWLLRKLRSPAATPGLDSAGAPESNRF